MKGCADATIGSDRVGAIHIAMPLDSVRRRCRIIRDTTEMDEGLPGQVVYVLVARDTLRLNVLNDAVTLIRVRRPGFATTDSIRVGMTVGRFLAGRHPTILIGEGKVYLVDRAHCGNSFGLSAEAYARAAQLTEESLARLPRSTAIDEIVVTGSSVELPHEHCVKSGS
jgi:hypothetical protein